MERRLREKIGLEEKQVRHVMFGHLLDSSVEMSGRQLVVVIGRELWTIRRTLETSSVHGAFRNRVQDLALRHSSFQKLFTS